MSGPAVRQSLGVTLRALELRRTCLLRSRGGSHPSRGEGRVDIDQQVPLLHAVADANQHPPHFSGRTGRKARTLKRAHVTEERPLRLDAPLAHLSDPNSRGRRPVGPALGRRLAFAAQGHQ